MRHKIALVTVFAMPLFATAQNVGIGNNMPHAPLQFAQIFDQNRKIILYEGSNSDHQFDGFGVNPGLMRYQIISTNDSHVFYAGVNGTTSNELLRIQGNGNVGIGTSNPTYPLTIGGNNGTNGVIGLDNGASVFAKNNSGVYERAFSARWIDNITYLNYGSGGFRILSNGGVNQAMYMDNAGNVGIGTNLPGAKLDVAGSVILTNAQDNSNGNVGIGGNPQNNGKVYIKSNQSYGLYLDGSSPAGGALLRVGGTSGGNMVKIDGTAAGYHLYIDGTAAKTDGNAFWSLPSDARLKEQITPYQAGLAELLQINPVKYHYTKASGLNNGHENIGILAQQLQKVAPYMVFKKNGENTDEEFYNVNLSPMLFMYVNAFKELDAKNKTQEDRIAKLEALVKQLLEGKNR